MRRRLQPTLVIERELAAPLDAVDGRTADGRPYRKALCLGRLHGTPLGLVPVEMPDGHLDARALAGVLARGLQGEIADHLAADGIDSPGSVSADGVAAAGVPRCLRKRADFLASAPHATVVIPTRERPRVLDRCLEHLVALDYPSYEIVVVDNAPTSDGTRRLVSEWRERFPQLRYLREDRPGQSWARNRGLAAASSPLVAFADDDVVVDRGWLAAIAAAFASSDRVGCVTGLILPSRLETEAQLLLEQFGGFNKGFTRKTFELDEATAADPLFPYAAGRFGSGASMAFDAEVLRGVGGFPVALGTGSPPCGGEDLTAFLKVVLAGRRLVYEPAAIAYHPHPETYGDLVRQLFGYGRGLGAYITSCIVDHGLAASLPSRVLPAARYLLGRNSPRNENRSAAYPRSLVAAELLGLAIGPFTYARGRPAAAVLSRSAEA